MAANKTTIYMGGASRSEKSNCLLLAVLALASGIGLPLAFIVIRTALTFVSSPGAVDSVYSPFASVGFYIWLFATPLITITGLLAGRYEQRRDLPNQVFTDIGIILCALCMILWTMPAVVILLSRVFGGGW
jgi:hypothetical protein